MDEFSCINRFFSPLAKSKEALNLTDDCAIIAPNSDNKELVISKDALVETVHFLPNTPPSLIARKALGVNLSDIAAMGATPRWYMLALMLPKPLNEIWLEELTQELSIIQKQYNITLIGGDTVSHPNKLSLSVTVIGEVNKGAALRRNNAKPGDGIYVSGTIGDSALGLKILTNQLPDASALTQEQIDFLIHRYHVPQPRCTLGKWLSANNYASAAIDISDGLWSDMKHICKASNVGASIHQNAIPLSNSAQTMLHRNKSYYLDIIGGGDDYEILFCAPQHLENLLLESSLNSEHKITKIGTITSNKEMTLIDEKGDKLPITKMGYNHFTS